MRSGEQIFLDLGCAFAQDIRRLVYDGVDSSKCYGSDLRLNFMELGYDLFRDKETLQSKFIPGDVFDDNSPLKELNGKVDIIGTSSFFHLFSLDKQKIIARRVAKLMKPQSGSLVVGKQVGSTEPHEAPGRPQHGTRYQHNLDSWRKLWAEIGEETGVKFEVEGGEIPIEEVQYKEICDIILHYSVRRL
jgi:SAM-dependent methyltransferase